MKVLLWARFCRPDKRKRHPAIGAAEIMPDGALHAYPAFNHTARNAISPGMISPCQ